MKLLTKTLERILPHPSSLKDLSEDEWVIHAHFYNPYGEGDWFVIAGERTMNDYNFYGVQFLDDFVIGPFSLRDLESIKLPFGETIKRSKSFKKTTLSDLKQNLFLYLD